MGTKAQTALMTLVYAGLAICLIGLQTTALAENFPHQVFGIAFFVLLVFHLIANRFWIRHSLSGRWDASRIFLTVIDAALVLLSIIQAVNCVLLSSFFWSMLPQDFAFFSSSFHMCIGTWIFVIAAIHLGLNANALIGNRLRLNSDENRSVQEKKRHIPTLLVWLLLGVIGVYGIFEIFQLQMIPYLFMLEPAQTETSIALVARFLQYLCVGIALAEIAHCISVFIQYCKRKRVGEAEFKA